MRTPSKEVKMKHDPWHWAWLALSVVLAGFFLANVIYYTKVKRQCTALQPGAVNSMIVINSVGLAVIIILWFAYIIYSSIQLKRGKSVAPFVPSTLVGGAS